MATISIGIRQYWIHSILNHMFRNGAFAVPTTLYHGYLTSGPTDTAVTGAVELSHADYARKAITFAAAANNQIANSADVTHVASASSAWNSGNPIKLWGLWDAATAGNLIHVDQVSPVLTVGAGNPVIAVAGTVRLYLFPRTAEV